MNSRALVEDEVARRARVYELNMTKLSHLLPAMTLTVEERTCLTELLDAWHGAGVRPPLPWARERETVKKVKLG